MKISPEYIKRKNGQIVMTALHKLKGSAKLDRIVRYIAETENTNPDKIRIPIKKILINGLHRGFLQRGGNGCYSIFGDYFVPAIQILRVQQKSKIGNRLTQSGYVAIRTASEMKVRKVQSNQTDKTYQKNIALKRSEKSMKNLHRTSSSLPKRKRRR